MRCIHCQNEIVGAYCTACWANLASDTPLNKIKPVNNMIDEQAIQSIMEVVDDELSDLWETSYIDTLKELRNRISEIINSNEI